MSPLGVSHPNVEFNLNCVIRGGDRGCIFIVSISCANTVGGLKHAIEIKKGCVFCDVDSKGILLGMFPYLSTTA